MSFTTPTGAKVIVVGDIICDIFTQGEMTRISPEAPAPVVKVTGPSIVKPGGAANVAVNVKALGGFAWLVGAVGGDGAWADIEKRLEEAGIDKNFRHVLHSNIPTVAKQRIIVGGRQVMRVDFDSHHRDNVMLRSGIPNQVSQLITVLCPGAIIASNYGKGVFISGQLRQIADRAAEDKVPLIVDCYGQIGADWEAFRTRTILKYSVPPEGYPGMPMHQSKIESDVRYLLGLNKNIDAIIVTRGSKGLYCYRQPEQSDFHMDAIEVDKAVDAVGAGDTVAAALGVGIGAGWTLMESCAIAVQAAGLVCQQAMTGCVSFDDIAKANHDLICRTIREPVAK